MDAETLTSPCCKTLWLKSGPNDVMLTFGLQAPVVPFLHKKDNYQRFMYNVYCSISKVLTVTSVVSAGNKKLPMMLPFC